MLITWHWVSVVLGLASMGIAYADSFKADQILIEKFGNAYKRYIDLVPRVNFVAGIIRLTWSQRNNKTISKHTYGSGGFALH